ncbi:MAG: adenylate/guanylate cyclase domain-containing protein, partial [Elusimicrobia bacterium]|nr:adenylate/guanylate cyclase domain-containing protein [Elusimicrobiota bacterium]
MRNKLRRNSLFIAVLGACLVSFFYWYEGFTSFENISLDYRFKIRGPQKPKSPVVIAAIDNESLENVGKWPWRREIHARLVDILRRAGASAIVFDVLFYEPDREHPKDDSNLSRAIQDSQSTVMAFSFDYNEEQYSKVEAGKTILVKEAVISRGEPLPSLVVSAKAMGYVNCFPDPDGYLRRAPLVYDYEGETYYPLNLQAVSVAKKVSAQDLLKNLPLTPAISWGNPSQEVLINYRGPTEGTFTTYSCNAILEGMIPDQWLKDKIILIGSTALGLYDHYPTPFSSSFPGLYFHANVVDNLWSNDFLIPVSNAVTFALILVFALACGVAIPRVPAGVGAFLVLGVTAAFWYLNYTLMVRRLFYIELVAPTASLIGNYLFVFFYRFVVEQREKASIKRAFGVYVNPHVVDQIAKNPDSLKLGGEMREMSVMFSDVAGFTTISEKLTPQELVQLLNLYLTKMTDTIMSHDGTVDKYEGDAIMAFWGAPLAQPQHAKLACLAVLENRERLRELNQDLESKGMQKLSARCGINTGPMNVGNMGSAQKFNYTVMG